MATKRYNVLADLTARSDGKGTVLFSEVSVGSSPPAEGTWTDYLEFKPGLPFNFSVWGTFDGVVSLERTFDGGDNWRLVHQITDATDELLVDNYESGVLWRAGVRNGDRTSGTLNARISQSP